MGTGRGTRARRATIVVGAFLGALVFAPGASAVIFAADGPSLGAIPDNGTCNAYGSDLDVNFSVNGIADAPGDVAVGFTLSPAHTFVGDLEVTLIAPDGHTKQTIFSRTGAVPAAAGGDSSNVEGPYTFSDQATDQPDGGWWQAAAAVDDNTALPSGTYRSTAPGANNEPGPAPFTLITPAFAHLGTSNGNWTLRFRDWCNGENGAVSAATLSLGRRLAVTNTNDTGAGSLRDAITTANASPGLDVIDATGVSGTINLASPLDALTETADILGPGASQLAVRRDTGSYGIFEVGSAVPVTISGLTIANGSTGGGGGGVVSQGKLTLDHVVLKNNTAAFGGGVMSLGPDSSLTVRDSTFSENSATDGGAIYDSSVSSTIERSTITGNSASDATGGIIEDATDTAVIRNSTITGNFSSGSADGDAISIPNFGHQLNVENSTIGANGTRSSIFVTSGSFIAFESSILSRVGAAGNICVGTGLFVSEGYNVASDATCGLGQSTDQPLTDPQLGPLADNGGPTLTMTPAVTSPAIDRGNLNSLTEDQRGQPRPVDMLAVANSGGGFAADVGAVEAQTAEVPNPAVTVSGGPTGTVSSSQPTFGFAAQNATRVECSIDHGTPSYRPCSDAGSDTPAGALADGSWIFRVRATTATGAEATDSRSFSVDTTAPSVSVDSGPNGPTLDQTPRFSFSAGEPATFACRLFTSGQAPDFGACTGPGQTYAPGSIADGKYTFAVRATDAAGNTATASRSFTLTASSCRQALQDVIDANGALEKAKAKLRKAKASGNKAKVKKAKKALKNARKTQASAKDAVSQLCVTSDD